MKKKIDHFMLPEHTNSLYKNEAISSISLTKGVAEKINELVDELNKLSKEDLAWKQNQEGIIRKGVIYMKDNLLNSLNDLMETLKNSGFIDSRIEEQTAMLNSRLTTLLNTVVPGSTTRDAEIIDARLGEDNIVYSNLGEAIRTQINNTLHMSGSRISSTTYEALGISDINNLPLNKSYFTDSDLTSDMVANLPVYSEYGFIMSLQSIKNSRAGSIQLYFTRTNLYCRFNVGSGTDGTWYPWIKISESPYHIGKVNISASNYKAVGIYDANDIKPNSVHFFNAWSLTNDMVANLPVYDKFISIFTFNYDEGQAGSTQIASATTGSGSIPDLYYRMCIGVSPNITWSEWMKVANSNDITRIENLVQNPNINTELIGAFAKIGVIGDSLSVGYIQDRDDTTASSRQLAFSWPKYIERDTGTNFIHLGKSGMTTRSWFTDTTGYTEATKDENLSQAYIICLGANDVSNVALGTVNDIDVANSSNNADTYYGNYAKIISTVKTINPAAKIFVFTMPYPRLNEEYNAAIRTMADLFNDVYVVDLANNYNSYFNSGILAKDYVNGHYTAIGYRFIATINKMAISEVMANNVIDFHNIDEIPYN